MTSTLLTSADVARLLGCNVQTVRRRVREGALVAARLAPAGRMRFDPDDLPSGDNMSIFHRKDRGHWPYLDISYTAPNGQKHRTKVRCPSRNPRACAAFERQVRAEIAAGTFHHGRHATVRAMAPNLVRWLKTQGRKPSYVDAVRSVLKHHLVPYFGARALSSLHPSDIDSYREAKADLAPKTVVNHLGVLSKLLRLAQRDGLVMTVPRIELPRLEVHEAPFLGADEANRLLEHCRGRLRTMIIIALDTGVRLGELIALHWSDVNLETANLAVRRQWCQRARTFTEPKNGRHRTIPLTPRAVAELRGHIRRLRCPLVFYTCSGRVVDKPDAGKALRRACERAGMEPCGWHRFRHTFASWLVQRGVDLYTVQRLLGHSTIQQTQRYAHLSQQSLAEAIGRLG